MTTQLDAVRVLTGIIRRAQEERLPDLSWSLPHYDAALRAQFPATADDKTKRAGMKAWGAHLGVKVKTDRCDDYTSLDITTKVDGIFVQIFCHVDRAATYHQAGGA